MLKRALPILEFRDPFPENLRAPYSVEYISDFALVRFFEPIQTGINRDALYIVERNYTINYKLKGDPTPHSITVPAGMLTDLASVPRILRWFLGRVGPHLEAAIVHDFLYAAVRWGKEIKNNKHKRKFADQIFLVGMREAGINPIKAWTIYLAVRAFGRIFGVDDNHDNDFLDTRDPDVKARLHL